MNNESITVDNVDKHLADYKMPPVWDQALAEDLTQRLHKISNKNYIKAETVAKKVFAEICDMVDEENDSTDRWYAENGFEPSPWNHIAKPSIWSEKMDDGRTKWLIGWEDSPIDDDWGRGWIAGTEGCTYNNCSNCMEAENPYIASFL